MFGWFKKRVLAKMNTLAYVANMTTYLAALERVRSKSTAALRDSESEAMKAAAMTNYLFGKAPSDMHTTQLDLGSEHRAAVAWLQEDSMIRELIVQSLRVMTTTAHGGGKGASIVGEEILSRFGATYPQAPDPASYEALVMRAVQTLPTTAQMEISRRVKNQGK